MSEQYVHVISSISYHQTLIFWNLVNIYNPVHTSADCVPSSRGCLILDTRETWYVIRDTVSPFERIYMEPLNICFSLIIDSDSL